MAIEKYSEALDDAPEVAGLRLELADLLAREGQVGEAVAVLETDPTGDRQVLLRQGELLVQLGEHERALAAYRRMLERDPRDEEALRQARAARAGAGDARRCRRSTGGSRDEPQITRADLAALLAVKVTALSRMTAAEPRVAVDISGSWAREHIIKVLSLRHHGRVPEPHLPARARRCAAATWRAPCSTCWTCWAIRRRPRRSWPT